MSTSQTQSISDYGFVNLPVGARRPSPTEELFSAVGIPSDPARKDVRATEKRAPDQNENDPNEDGAHSGTLPYGFVNPHIPNFVLFQSAGPKLTRHWWPTATDQEPPSGGARFARPTALAQFLSRPTRWPWPR